MTCSSVSTHQLFTAANAGAPAAAGGRGIVRPGSVGQ